MSPAIIISVSSVVFVLGVYYLYQREREREKENKVFYIQEYNEEGELMEDFGRYEMNNKEEFLSLLQRLDAKGLSMVDDDSNNVITSLNKIIDNQKYQVNSPTFCLLRK